MKKFMGVLIAIAVMISLLNCCGGKTNTESSAVPATESSTQTTDIVTIEETTIEKTVSENEEETWEEKISEYVAYKFSVEIENCKKTEYEKEYSSEILTEIYESIPMYFGLTFGCDDYDNWNGTPNDVLNDIYHSRGYWMIESYDYESVEHKMAMDEFDKSPYGRPYYEGFYTSVEKINSLLRDVYGPDARVFKAEDFDTYDELMKREENIFSDYDYSFRFCYLPESEIVCCFAREIWGGETQGVCVCDVRMLNGDYIVEAVYETYYVYRAKYVMTMSRESNGNIYIKSIDDFYVLPDGAENNLKVISEDVKVKSKKYNSGEWVIVGTLFAGDEVYSAEDFDDAEEYILIVSEDFRGIVEKKYLLPIE